jgi:transposase
MTNVEAGRTPAHPAAYAGVAPVTRSSGTSIKGEHPARTGNRQLKRALFLAASAALSAPRRLPDEPPRSDVETS